MKKTVYVVILLLAMIATACGSTPTTQGFNRSNSAQSNNAPAELPLASRLVVGSFKLENTKLSITQKEAADLLPLWEVYRGLSTSDTAAQEEIDALTQQIQETMMPTQMQAINAMNLTQRDVFIFMQQQGIQFANGNGNGAQQSNRGTGGQNQGNNGQNNRRFQGGGFFAGGGGGPGGGFGGGQGQGFSPQQIATAQVLRAANGGGVRSNRTPAPLIEALIQMLQKKAGS